MEGAEREAFWLHLTKRKREIIEVTGTGTSEETSAWGALDLDSAL